MILNSPYFRGKISEQTIIARDNRASVTRPKINVSQFKNVSRFGSNSAALLFSKWMRQKSNRLRRVKFDRCSKRSRRHILDCRSFNPWQRSSPERAIKCDNLPLHISEWQNQPFQRPQPPFLPPDYLACARNNHSKRFATSVYVSRVFPLPLDLRPTSAPGSSFPTNVE